MDTRQFRCLLVLLVLLALLTGTNALLTVRNFERLAQVQTEGRARNETLHALQAEGHARDEALRTLQERILESRP